MNAHDYTSSKIAQMKTLCLSLKGLPLTAFTHDQTNDAKRHGMLTTSKIISKMYLEEKIPMNYMDRSGKRLMREGLHTTAMLHENYAGHHPTERLFSKAINANHHIHYLKKHSNSEHLFTWSFSCDSATFENILLNESRELLHFANGYLKENTHMIQQSMHPENTIAYSLSSCFDNTQQQNTYFNRKTGCELVLSPRKTDCLELLLEGMSAKEIAAKLYLSYRTVQHYLDTIRYNNDFKTVKDVLLFAEKV